VAHFRAVPLALHSLDPMTARTASIGGGGELLVRPDRPPTGWWSPDAGAGATRHAAIHSASSGRPAPPPRRPLRRQAAKYRLT
jgi:hypothetical protein